MVRHPEPGDRRRALPTSARGRLLAATAAALTVLGAATLLGIGPAGHESTRASTQDSASAAAEDAAAMSGLDLTTAARSADADKASRSSRSVAPSSKPSPKPRPKASPQLSPKASSKAQARTTAPRITTAAPPKAQPKKTTAPTTSKPVSKPSGSMVSQVIALVNSERGRAGCGALRESSQLDAAAYGHSKDMATHDYFSHVSQDGRTFDVRIRAAGYSGHTLGENIAAGQRTASAVMASWMGSSGHRANILNCAFKQIGVGVASGGSYGTYWTQDFGG
ncbi:CAP domain-containing protein [Angustibacter sp. McL0619]|uniref:CAP domain-containing protein n=1 Tax=Angustibacter sp. McL0619 TaxID=3415676 RepID=UPI003CF53775